MATRKIKKSEIQILEEEAQKGNIDALYNLGFQYLLGEDVEEDAYKAVMYFKRGTTHHDPKCMQALAMCYRNGDGVEKDLTKTVYWLNEGAKMNDPGCCYQLGLLYESGEGVKQDLDKAIELIKIGAQVYPDARKWLKAHGVKTPNFITRLLGKKNG